MISQGELIRKQIENDLKRILEPYTHFTAQKKWDRLATQIQRVWNKYQQAIGSAIDNFNVRIFADVSTGKSGRFIVRVTQKMPIIIHKLQPSSVENFTYSVHMEPGKLTLTEVIPNAPSLSSTVTKEAQDCKRCNGRGVEINIDSLEGEVRDCPKCDGTGIKNIE
jgi:phosphomannomutase